ncbi:motility protein A [Candidatus Auribacterota bacterium]
MAFINLPSLLITVGGTVSATLINYPLSILIQLVRIVKNTFFHQTPKEEKIVNVIIELAYAYRKDGLIGVEKKSKTVSYYFLRRGINLLLEGIKGDALDNLLIKEMYAIKERHRIGQDILHSMGGYAPAFGMIGTLIGLIQMLRTLNDPSSIGYGMSVALLTTFYGALVANLLCLPLAGKLKERSGEELLICDFVREGIVSISADNNPRLIKEKMLAFSNKRVRAKLQKSNQ